MIWDYCSKERYPSANLDCFLLPAWRVDFTILVELARSFTTASRALGGGNSILVEEKVHKVHEASVASGQSNKQVFLFRISRCFCTWPNLLGDLLKFLDPNSPIF